MRPVISSPYAACATLILFAVSAGGFVSPASAQMPIAVSAPVAPPPLPAYAQPALPGAGYLWIPGYWAWQAGEYFWVPGYWSKPPRAGLYWTPGYWAWDDADHDYLFFNGYWSPKVGFYGGVDYGFGYAGDGYNGGHWQGGQFLYNRDENNVAGTHVASFAEPSSGKASPVAFNGGAGGVQAFPTPEQLLMARDRRVRRTPEQIRQQDLASRLTTQRYDQNGGRPPIAATPRAAEMPGGHATLPPDESLGSKAG